MFQKPIFLRELRHNNLPESLLNAVFAVASRFVLPANRIRVFGAFPVPEDKFYELAQGQSREELDQQGPICLNDVKRACLLAIYEYTRCPSRKALVLVGTAVRLALLARLHQVDCEGSLASLSDAEQEE